MSVTSHSKAGRPLRLFEPMDSAASLPGTASSCSIVAAQSYAFNQRHVAVATDLITHLQDFVIAF